MKECYFIKRNTPPLGFLTFFKLYKWYKIAQRIILEQLWNIKYSIGLESYLNKPNRLINVFRLQVSNSVKNYCCNQHKNRWNPWDKFLSVDGVLSVVMNSQKLTACTISAWSVKSVISWRFNRIIKEKRKKITEKNNQFE